MPGRSFCVVCPVKTAYEIMPSLVGSEMCIRDRPGTQLRMEGADQLQALEEHLHSAIVNCCGVIIQLTPVEFGVKPAAIGGDLILRQLAGLPQPAIGVAVEPPPVEERVQIDGAATQLNAVLLQPALQLNILLLCRRHIPKAGGPRYR